MLVTHPGYRWWPNSGDDALSAACPDARGVVRRPSEPSWGRRPDVPSGQLPPWATGGRCRDQLCAAVDHPGFNGRHRPEGHHADGRNGVKMSALMAPR